MKDSKALLAVAAFAAACLFALWCAETWHVIKSPAASVVRGMDDLRAIAEEAE